VEKSLEAVRWPDQGVKTTCRYGSTSMSCSFMQSVTCRQGHVQTGSPYRPASFTSLEICLNLSVPASPNSSKRIDSQVVILAPS